MWSGLETVDFVNLIPPSPFSSQHLLISEISTRRRICVEEVITPPFPGGHVHLKRLSPISETLLNDNRVVCECLEATSTLHLLRLSGTPARIKA